VTAVMKTVQNDLNSHRLSWTEAGDLTTLDGVGDYKCYTLTVVQANDEDS